MIDDSNEGGEAGRVGLVKGDGVFAECLGMGKASKEDGKNQ
jgi:hypothetical protein